MAAAAVIPRIAAQIESYVDQVILGTPFDGDIDSTLNASVPLGCELEVERVWDQVCHAISTLGVTFSVLTCVRTHPADYADQGAQMVHVLRRHTPLRPPHR